MLFLPFLVGVCIWVLLAAAQAHSSSWRLIDSPIAGEDYGVAGNFYSHLVDFDIVTNRAQYQDTLKQYFLLAQENRVNFSDPTLYKYNSDPTTVPYGYAAARAYAAYKDPLFLAYAVDSWWFGRAQTIFTEDIESGALTVKNFSFAQYIEPGNAQIDALTVGQYNRMLQFDLQLRKREPNRLFGVQAAQQSAEFLQTQLYDVIASSMSGSANDSCAVGSTQFPWNSGIMIEQLAILTSITESNSTQNLLNDIIQAAIVNDNWVRSDGIVSTFRSSKQGDLYLVRGLGAAYSHGVVAPAARSDVESFLAVQVHRKSRYLRSKTDFRQQSNAVVDLATSGSSSIYAATWLGPSSSTFRGGNQVDALGPLITAIGLPTVPSTISGTPPSASQTGSVSPIPTVKSRNTSLILIVSSLGYGACCTNVHEKRQHYLPPQ
ncbi:hypothetical protein B0H13DRAFT_1919098 [Mycena leptocephala]|nr:hypothetical protein B0H13DRAFT_1919098 [Mycena leptocephala]